MAPTQELKNVKYDLLRAEQEQKLHEIFSPDIIAWGRSKGFTTFDDFNNYQGVLKVDVAQSLKGLSYVPMVTTLLSRESDLKSLDVSANIGLETIIVHQSNLNNITFSPSNNKVIILEFYANNVVGVLNVSSMILLKKLYAHANKLTNVKGLNNCTKLSYCVYINSNAIHSKEIDNILKDLAVAKSAGAPFTAVRLENQRNPDTNELYYRTSASDAAFVQLIEAGVSITVDEIHT